MPQILLGQNIVLPLYSLRVIHVQGLFGYIEDAAEQKKYNNTNILAQKSYQKLKSKRNCSNDNVCFRVKHP